MIRTLALLIALSQLTACVRVYDFSSVETLEFNYAAPSQAPVGYADLLCCFDCTV